MTSTHLDLHVVLHVRKVQTTAGIETMTTVVAGPTDWHDAQRRWDKMDNNRRRRNSQTTRKIDDYFAVRSVHDPLVQPLLERCSYHANEILAAKAWGKANEVKGNKGGWIFGLGATPVQGWFLASRWLQAHNSIGTGLHPKTGKFSWINYGSPLVRPLADSRV